MATEIDQHLTWMNLYVGEMNSDNWRDMRGRLQHQLEQLSLVVNAQSSTAAEQVRAPRMSTISARTIANGIVNQALGHEDAIETKISVATLLLGIEAALVDHAAEQVRASEATIIVPKKCTDKMSLAGHAAVEKYIGRQINESFAPVAWTAMVEASIAHD